MLNLKEAIETKEKELNKSSALVVMMENKQEIEEELKKYELILQTTYQNNEGLIFTIRDDFDKGRIIGKITEKDLITNSQLMIDMEIEPNYMEKVEKLLIDEISKIICGIRLKDNIKEFKFNVGEIVKKDIKKLTKGLFVEGTINECYYGRNGYINRYIVVDKEGISYSVLEDYIIKEEELQTDNNIVKTIYEMIENDLTNSNKVTKNTYLFAMKNDFIIQQVSEENEVYYELKSIY